MSGEWWLGFTEHICTSFASPKYRDIRLYFTILILVEKTGNCLSNPCVHGVCKESPYSFTCDCFGTGYKGDRCDG